MQERSKSMAELIQLFIYIIHICEDKLQHFAASCQLRVSGCQFLAFGALREVETSFLFINRFRLAVSVRRSVRFSYKQSRAADASQTNDII